MNSFILYFQIVASLSIINHTINWLQKEFNLQQSFLKCEQQLRIHSQFLAYKQNLRDARYYFKVHNLPIPILDSIEAQYTSSTPAHPCYGYKSSIRKKRSSGYPSNWPLWVAHIETDSES